MSNIQTILVEADEQTRIQLRIALRSQPGIEVASEATNGTTGLVLLESIDVDVAIVNAQLPDMSIQAFVEQMRILQAEASVTPSKLLILLDPEQTHSLTAALAAPAAGYCFKNQPVEQLAVACRHINAGYEYFDPVIAECITAKA